MDDYFNMLGLQSNHSLKGATGLKSNIAYITYYFPKAFYYLGMNVVEHPRRFYTIIHVTNKR